MGMIISINKKRITGFITYIIIAVAMIYTSGYALAVSEGGSSRSIFLLTIALAALMIRRLPRGKIRIEKTAASYVFILFEIGIVLSILANFSRSNLFEGAKPALGMMIAWLLISYIDIDQFVKVFTKTLCVLTVISLLGYVYFVLLGKAVPFPTFVNTNDEVYYNGYIYLIWKRELVRNISLFWEPSIFSSYLNIAIALNIIYRNKKLWSWENILFIVGILSAVSTGGYVMLLFNVLLYFFRSKDSRKNIIIFAVLGICILVAYINMDSIMSALLGINYSAFVKLFNLTGEGSSYTRILSPLNNLKIFLQNPVTGFGFSKANSMYIVMDFASIMVRQTSTVTFVLAALGIWGLAYDFGWLIGVLRIKMVGLISKICFFIILMISLNIVPQYNFLFTYTLMMLILADNRSLKRAEACH